MPTHYIDALLQLVFPQVCEGCGQPLSKADILICSHCRVHLPFANYINEPDNPVSRKFYGKVMLKEAFAIFLYNKSSSLQRLIHKLKYERQPEIGTLLGKIAGQYAIESDKAGHWDVVVPVPLHSKKEKQRGYNQAAVIAESFAQSIGARYLKQVLVRNEYTQSQTRKSRLERNRNVAEIFSVDIAQAQLIEGKSVALIDDVVTTGATCEHCLIALSKLQPKDMSVIALATAVS